MGNMTNGGRSTATKAGTARKVASKRAAPAYKFDAAAETMPRLRRACETEGPEPLRRRRLLAPPEFLTSA